MATKRRLKEREDPTEKRRRLFRVSKRSKKERKIFLRIFLFLSTTFYALAVEDDDFQKTTSEEEEEEEGEEEEEEEEGRGALRWVLFLFLFFSFSLSFFLLSFDGRDLFVKESKMSP